MQIALGTDDGVFQFDGRKARQLGLSGTRVTHVARSGEQVLAAVPRDGVYRLAEGRVERVFSGDARSCAIGPDGSYYAGVEPAMIYRSESGGRTWTRADAIDRLPSRSSWTFPPPPHQPHVLSIDFLPGEPSSVLVGIEVGGVIRSADRGKTWSELNRGVYVDVHSVRPDRERTGQLFAVTGRGFYASEDGGLSWERRMKGMERGYTMGLHIHPERAGEVLVSAGDRPPGLNGRVYHTVDGGRSWSELAGSALPELSRRAAVPLFRQGAAWLGLDSGDLLRAERASGPWKVAGEVGVPINAMVAEGSPSSVMH